MQPTVLIFLPLRSFSFLGRYADQDQRGAVQCRRFHDRYGRLARCSDSDLVHRRSEMRGYHATLSKSHGGINGNLLRR